MCKILFTVFLLLFTKLIHSQNNLDTIYFDENWEKIEKEKSVYFRLLKKKSNGWYECKDYWRSGELQMEGHLSVLDPEIKEGEFIWYKKDKSKSQINNYKNNIIIGTIKRFNVDNIKMVEIPPSMDSLDNSNDFREENILFAEYINNNSEYPKIAKENGIQGSVLLSFYIGPNGKVFGITVLRSINDLLSQEAFRLISKYEWPKPLYKKKPISISYAMPIKFKLTD